MKSRTLNFRRGQKSKFRSFLKSHRGYRVYDYFEDLSTHYELVRKPRFYFASKDVQDQFIRSVRSKLHREDAYSSGSWIVLDPHKEIYHMPKVYKYLDLRTIRNRNLITSREQRILYNKRILFVGLSVGSQVVSNFVRTGIGKKFVLVDGDEVEVHNLNRTNYFLQNLGEKKAEVIGRQILSIDPYLEIEVVKEFLNEKNLEKLLDNVDLVVDSFDNFSMKIKLRELAKKLKLPIVSGFDISRGSVLIVERYDVEEDLDLSFYLNDFTQQDILSLNDKGIEGKTKAFIQIIGEEYHDYRMLRSVLSVGKTLTGYPQLSIATCLTSSLWTAATIDILLNRVGKSLKVCVDLDKFIYK